MAKGYCPSTESQGLLDGVAVGETHLTRGPLSPAELHRGSGEKWWEDPSPLPGEAVEGVFKTVSGASLTIYCYIWRWLIGPHLTCG